MLPTPVSKKIRSRLNLSIQKKPHFLFRSNLSLEKKEKWEPTLRKGHPEFAKQFDILNRQVTGFRKYKPPPAKREELKRNYDITNFHEVKSKFRFEINGFFQVILANVLWNFLFHPFVDGGNVFCDELYTTAKRMFLVGWIKCRRRFAIGHVRTQREKAPSHIYQRPFFPVRTGVVGEIMHASTPLCDRFLLRLYISTLVFAPCPTPLQFQGDSYAISYLRHWFDMYSSEFNKIENLKIFDENHGIPNFDY
ncbi:conserved Plasmodium protein, unknown function [Plasmodium ovale wallikeri]|uniref:Uncharacterized protein n=1 Tax=Plasmodium ovale wallikeri TaxID=864142 RepID=A0A1A8Z745_PLAOA|nr:conserved Plasmodium protein, unknown function [Plasmodium ovale wallikeri]SBT39759.1 conserved Plasmodium protein, unknown function [Plasmodium ovale wallikeri]